VAEISTPEDRQKILDIYRGNVARLTEERPDSSSAAWIRANSWMVNRPGSTMFFPLVDVSAEYINILLAGFEREKLRMIGEHTCDWAGIRKHYPEEAIRERHRNHMTTWHDAM
jgi:hypothetical protein